MFDYSLNSQTQQKCLYMNYFVLLLCKLNLSILDLRPGEERWVEVPLSNSYEHAIIEGRGACSVHEYRQLFFEQGLLVRHLEVQHNVLTFNNLYELQQWIHQEMAARVDCVEGEDFEEQYLQLLQTRGWIDIGDGKIRFPHRQLLALLYAPLIDDGL